MTAKINAIAMLINISLLCRFSPALKTAAKITNNLPSEKY